MKIGRAYLSFAASAKDGLGPASAEELKKWLLEDDKRVSEIGLTKADVDGIFVSPRDNQPYEIQPKRHPSPFIGGGGGPPGKGGPPGRGGPGAKTPGYGQPGILVNEKAGVDGKRMIFSSGSQIQEVDDGEFRRLLSGG